MLRIASVLSLVQMTVAGNHAFFMPLGLRDSSWCWDWTSNPGTWGHVGVRFPLGGVVVLVCCFLLFGLLRRAPWLGFPSRFMIISVFLIYLSSLLSSHLAWLCVWLAACWRTPRNFGPALGTTLPAAMTFPWQIMARLFRLSSRRAVVPLQALVRWWLPGIYPPSSGRPPCCPGTLRNERAPAPWRAHSWNHHHINDVEPRCRSPILPKALSNIIFKGWDVWCRMWPCYWSILQLIVFGSNTHPRITSFLETLGDGSCRVL